LATIDCTLTTPERKVFEGAVRSVVVPAEDGELGILPRHAPLVASLGTGVLRLEPASEPGAKRTYFVDGGFVQVLGDQVTVLAQVAVLASEIDRAREEAAVDEIRAAKPGLAAPIEEKDAHARALRAAKIRLQSAGRTSR
jgi:F-type H+-transporting ATPase subunit epsilon